MKFPKQEYWSGLPFSSPGNLPDPGIEPAGRFFIVESPGKPQHTVLERKKPPWVFFVAHLMEEKKLKSSNICETDFNDLVESYYFKKITLFLLLIYRFLRQELPDLLYDIEIKGNYFSHVLHCSSRLL